jgi:two-component system cell cycle response regulator DivK
MKLARDLLQYHGFTVVAATSAEDGLALARAQPPALILMDIQLPGMDGVTALSHLRSEPGTSAVPVVAMTASVMKEDRVRFENAGFDGFITKPIDVRAFPQQVRDHVARGRA